MRKLLRRGISLAMVAGLAVVPASIPALAQEGSPASITHQQSVLTQLTETGELDTSRIFTQLQVAGDGPVEVVLPDQSTRGLRNLEGIGGPATDGDAVIYDIDATPDGVFERTVATHIADLPVSIEVAYELDGQMLENPRELVGRTGELTVTYKLRNETVEEQELDIFNARQESVTETVEVGVPLVGTLSLPLDSRFTDVRADDANVVGDGRGNTIVNWSLLLFEPLGSFEQELSWSAQVTDAMVPEANAQIASVDSDSFPSLPNAQSAYADTFVGLQTITDGAVRIDMTMLAILDGAGRLLDGMRQLADGSDELAAGLETAAAGSSELADGTGQASAGSQELATGLGQLASGAGELAGGTGQLRDGTGALSSGLGELTAGASQLAAGLSDAGPGAALIHEAISGIRAGTGTPDDANTIIGGLTTLRSALGGQILDGMKAVRVQQSNTAGCNFDDADGVAACGIEQIGEFLSTTLSGLDAELGPAISTALADAFLSEQLRGPAIAELAGQIGPILGLDEATATFYATLIVEGLTDSFAESFAPLFGQLFAAGFKEEALTPLSQVAGAVTLKGAGSADGLDQLISGIEGDVLEGMDALLAGLDNPGCDTDDPTNPANPCGVRQILELIDPGSAELAAGLEAASDGAAALAAGAADAAAGSREINDGMARVDDGTKALASGAQSAAQGGSDLSDGLAQIDEGTNALADGLGDARDGSGELAGGMGDAYEGGQTLVEGMDQLQEFGTNKIMNDVSRAGREPDRLLKQARAADERAKDGDGLPYGTVEEADASAIYRFEIAGVGDEEGLSTPARVGVALLAFGAAGALGLVVRRRLI
jgi:putative membrane protein